MVEKKSTKHRANETASASQSSERFPIVGVGASAGGLEALRGLLEAMPDQPGVAIVIVQHLARDKPSLSHELLARCTNMQVAQVVTAITVQPDHVYMIPPGQYLTITDGRLQLQEMETKRSTPVAIDLFLRSLAKDQQQRTIGVILSGTGSDGVLGVKAIHEAGGLVIAQDPNDAEHSSMPEHAIETGVVDQVLSVAEMPDAIITFTQHSYFREFASDEKLVPIEAEGRKPSGDAPDSSRRSVNAALTPIIKILRERGNRDFRNYKETTLLRRTRRRMCLHHLDDFAEYEQYLKENPEEIEALAKDLLISVTDFFRDPEVWEQLSASVIPKMIESKNEETVDETVRVWVPACATGEEAYTVAILIFEELRRQNKSIAVQIFASDIDRQAIEVARAGRYASSIEADVSRRRLSRYFTIKDGDTHYQVNKSLRESIVFAVQNMISDPPFSQMDLICCRNVLIYLKPDLQQRLIALFHFALREQGYLMLGSAETIGRQNDLFDVVHKRSRIFRATIPMRQGYVDFPIKVGAQRLPIGLAIPAPRRDVSLMQLAQKRLLELTGPTALLIDDHLRILYINGDVEPYLMHRQGVPSDDLLTKLRPSMRSKLRVAIRSAFADGQDVRTTCRMQQKDNTRLVQVDVRLLNGETDAPSMALVIFETIRHSDAQTSEDAATVGSPPGETPDADASKSIENEAVIRQLETELSAAKDDLQLTIEQFEVSSEEFKASNEEVLSINEELQSTNEELETSKEELQSLNEELATVNHQLGLKVGELETKHADLENLIAATEVATICLDTDLTIRWFTDAVKQLIRIRPTDCGRPLSELAHDFSDDDLVSVCEQVLRQLSASESEITTPDDRAFIRRIVPYRSSENQIGGVVITLLDISNRRRREEELRASRERFRRALTVDGIGVLFFDADRKVIDCNDWFLEMTGYTRHDVESGAITSDSLTPPQGNELTRNQWDLFEQTGRLGPYDKQLLCKDGTLHWMTKSGCRMEDGTAVVHCIDIADQKQSETELRELNKSLENQVEQRTVLLHLLQGVTRIANEASSVEEALQAAMSKIATFNGWLVGHVWRNVDDNGSLVESSKLWHLPDDVDASIKGFRDFRELTERTRLELAEGLIGEVVESRQPKWLDDIGTSDTWVRKVPGLGLHAALAFPIVIDGTTVAVMEFFSTTSCQPERRFLEIMPDIGIQLGYVVRRKRMEQLVEEIAIEEQRRIGRELHDGISQQLTGGALIAESLRQSLTEHQSKQLENATHLVEIFKSTHDDVRTLSSGLMIGSLDASDLPEKLNALAHEVSRRFSVACVFEAPQWEEVYVRNNATASAIYHITREAIHNAVKHAEAKRIAIEVSTNDSFDLVVRDDGIGFDAKQIKEHTNGLRIMKHRAQSVGGRLEIESTINQGTTIKLTIPHRNCQS